MLKGENNIFSRNARRLDGMFSFTAEIAATPRNVFLSFVSRDCEFCGG